MPFRSSSRRWFHLSSYVMMAGVAAGCGGDSTGPGGNEPGINIVAGANVTDTVDTPLPLALRVVVRDQAGRPVPGAVVRFSSVPIARESGVMVPSVLVGDLTTIGEFSFLAETTSAEGIASVRVVLGTTAGAGGIAVAVPEAGLEDTARFTILPGAPARVTLPIADTTLQVGRTIALGGRVEDRLGNARTGAVTYDAVATGLTISNGQLTVTAPARASVVARLSGSGLAPDTMWVSVVPAATIAVRRGTRLMIGTLEGTGLTEIPHTLDANDYGPEWHPSGQSLLAVVGSYSEMYSLYRVELNGAKQLIVTPTSSSANSFAVPGEILGITYSPGGEWIYLSGGNCNYNAILYRIPVANRHAIERLSPASTSECFELVNHWPSLSPDGARLAYENQTWNRSGYSVRVMTIATREIVEIVPGGQRPRWSPAGNLIAYWDDNQIWVVRPDGTEARAVSPPGHVYQPGVQWSPDGKWIIARFAPRQGWAGTTVALLNVDTGLEIPLAWTTGYGPYGLPAWKPTS